MRGSVAVALLIVFVDCVKELPATLLLRPFNWNTLSTRVYEQASLERLGDAAPAALLVMLVGLAAVALLARTTRAGWRSMAGLWRTLTAVDGVSGVSMGLLGRSCGGVGRIVARLWADRQSEPRGTRARLEPRRSSSRLLERPAPCAGLGQARPERVLREVPLRPLTLRGSRPPFSHPAL
jgi:hypothetical protein